jgi:hypothetical protein
MVSALPFGMCVTLSIQFSVTKDPDSRWLALQRSQRRRLTLRKQVRIWWYGY